MQKHIAQTPSFMISLESDKSSVEIPSTVSGKVDNVAVKVGDKVSKGDLLLNLTSSSKTSSESTLPKDTENIIKQAEKKFKSELIPLAGLGTRLLPLTSVFAKELLPINGKVGLEYIIEECIDAGIEEIIFIISKQKKMIKKYFYNDKI